MGQIPARQMKKTAWPAWHQRAGVACGAFASWPHLPVANGPILLGAGGRVAYAGCVAQNHGHVKNNCDQLLRLGKNTMKNSHLPHVAMQQSA
jgi:hypothetical protein